MGEIGDLVVVVGELDRELVRAEAVDPVAGAAARARAAELLPALGRRDAPGWYDRFLRATRSDPPVTGLEEALARLAARPESQVRPAHLLAVVGAVGRALGVSWLQASRGDILVDVLTRDGIVSVPGEPRSASRTTRAAPGDHRESDEGEAGDDGETALAPTATGSEAAGRLLELVVDPDVLPHIGRWQAFLERADVQELVHAELRSAPAACSAVVVPVVTRVGNRLALAVSADLCVDHVDFDTVIGEPAFLNPANWKDYAHWCAMHPAGDNPDDWTQRCRFLESVALDCEDSWWDIRVWLEFTRLHVADTPAGRRFAVREYDMVPVLEAPPGGNGMVRVDEGSFAVREERGGDGQPQLRVTSTKRVEFTQGVDEAALAVIACAVGYGAMSTAFVIDGLGDEAQSVACEPAPATSVSSEGAGEADGDPLDGPLRELDATIDACAEAAATSFSTMATGEYTFETLVQDMAASLSRSAGALVQLNEVLLVAADPPTLLDEVWTPAFEIPPHVQTPEGPCRLEVDGPLISLRERTLGPAKVRCVPRDLPHGQRAFRVVADGRGQRSGAYVGRVVVTHDGSPVTDPVRVFVQIP